MNSFFSQAYLVFNSIKVVHSLSGRVRLSIPGLRSLAPQYYYLKDELVAMMVDVKAIYKLEVTPHSGTALIYYDPLLLSEKQLIDWMSHEWKKVVKLISKWEDDFDEEALILKTREVLLADRDRWEKSFDQA